MAETRTKHAPSGFGPGSRLAQAREDRGLTLEEAARALRLAPRHVRAMESDDYESLPGPTYVRGYLRSYAQLLGLPADEIVASYNSLSVAQQPVDLGKLAPPAQLSSDHHLMRLVSALVLGLFVVLAGLWWYGKEETPAPIPSLPLSPPPAPEARLSAPSPDSVAPATLTPSDKRPQAADLSEGSRTSGGVTPRAPAGVGQEVAAGSRPAAPRVHLVLQAREESWAEVRDAAGNRLLYETIPAGRTVTVEGAAPLSVFLGNVDGVHVEFNGRPYDASRHKRGPVARFTLDEAQTAKSPVARPSDATH